MNARWTRMTREHVMWDDRDMKFCEMRPFIFHYFFVDDTLQIREDYKPNDERDQGHCHLRLCSFFNGNGHQHSGPIFRRV